MQPIAGEREIILFLSLTASTCKRERERERLLFVILVKNKTNNTIAMIKLSGRKGDRVEGRGCP